MRWLKATDSRWLITLFLPLLAPTCSQQEASWYGYQFVFVRATDHEVIAVDGFIHDAVQQGDDYLYFIESECVTDLIDWSCPDSVITLMLNENVSYDIYGWTEPSDRRDPNRVMVLLAENWEP